MIEILENKTLSDVRFNNNLLINPSKYLKKGENYYIYCNHGRTSKGLCSILNSLGYHVYSINGGYESWIAKHI